MVKWEQKILLVSGKSLVSCQKLVKMEEKEEEEEEAGGGLWKVINVAIMHFTFNTSLGLDCQLEEGKGYKEYINIKRI